DFIYISSSGNASFGKVNPSSSGSIATAQDTLSISTNCSAGFNIYISAVNDSATGTSLINNASDSNNEITTLTGTTIGTTAKALENNTWGFNTVNNNTYYGLPAHANAMDHAIYSGTNTSIPIYYGTKVTNALVPGKYTGQVLYTATVNSSCLNYTVIFNKNASDATGTMGNQTMSPSTATALTTNGFSRPGYVFLGWSTDQNATTATYTNGQSVTNLATSGSSITLYAVWAKSIQNFDCSEIALGGTATLTDVRDLNTYTIYRIPSTASSVGGKCIMTENLKLGSTIAATGTTGDTLTVNSTTSNYDTNASSSSGETFSLSGNIPLTYVAKNASSSSWPRTESYSNRLFTYDDTALSYYTAYGYYTWGAAIVACPAGWRLPTVGEGAAIFSAAGGLSITGSTYKWSAYGGYFRGSFYEKGSTSFIWTSTQISNEKVYNSYFTSSGQINNYGQDYKSRGYPVRCINDSGDLYMQDTSCSTLPAGQTSTLIDKRDNQTYTVYRLPTDSAATRIAGKCLMTQDLRLGMVTSGEITAGANLVLNTNTSTASGTVYMVGSSSPTYNFPTNPDSNTNHGYYDTDAAQLVCPKGWRIPEYVDYVSSTGLSKLLGSGTTASNAIRSAPWNFLLGGQDGYGSVTDSGTSGNYRVKLRTGTNNMVYQLHFTSTPVNEYASNFNDWYLTGAGTRGSVRCIAD
ncbi:InlB B-repeat-containing protein, partial [Candidatus Saccharibacteria bacterium]|nr:InlB B-repeat-containing protein [Candidatus Saccharibacteria bacterium]